MIERYNNLSLSLGIPGFLLQIGGKVILEFRNAVATTPPEENLWPVLLGILGIVVTLSGTVLLLFGLMYYAKSRGRHPAWCLCAFLSCLGLLVLACLKDLAPDDEPHDPEPFKL